MGGTGQPRATMGIFVYLIYEGLSVWFRRCIVLGHFVEKCHSSHVSRLDDAEGLCRLGPRSRLWTVFGYNWVIIRFEVPIKSLQFEVEYIDKCERLLCTWNGSLSCYLIKGWVSVTFSFFFVAS